MVKEQRFFLKKCEEHHGIFHTGSLTKPNMLHLELYFPQNDHILLPFTPNEVLTNFDWLGKWGVFREVGQVKKLLKKTVFKKYISRSFLLWRFLDWLHRISCKQEVLHQVSQFRELLKKMILENFVPRTSVIIFSLSKWGIW